MGDEGRKELIDVLGEGPLPSLGTDSYIGGKRERGRERGREGGRGEREGGREGERELKQEYNGTTGKQRLS